MRKMFMFLKIHMKYPFTINSSCFKMPQPAPTRAVFIVWVGIDAAINPPPFVLPRPYHSHGDGGRARYTDTACGAPERAREEKEGASEWEWEQRYHLIYAPCPKVLTNQLSR